MNKEFIVYNYVKALPLFNLNLGDKIIRIGNKSYIRTNVNSNLTRKAYLDDINLDDFAFLGYFEKTIECADLQTFKEGDFVVTSGDIANAKKIVPNPTCSNQVHKVIDTKNMKYRYNCKLSNTIKIKNVNTGKEQEITVDKIVCKTSKYWFLNSHGSVSATYFWLKPNDDAFRIATNNVYYSHEEAHKAITNFRLDIDNKANTLNPNNIDLGRAMLIDNAASKNIL